MAMTAAQQNDSYKFFIIAFGAAPGVEYMNQLNDAYASGMTTQQAVNVYTTKAQFTAMYPKFLTSAQFATSLVNNVVKGTASDAAKAQAVADIMGAINGGMSRGDVIFTVFNNLATKVGDATWGTTAQMFNNQIAVAKYYTEVQLGSATDVATLQAVVSGVTATTDVSSPSAIAALLVQASVLTFTLTTGQDTATAESFFASETYFNVDGKGPTINTGDRLTGTTGKTTNTLTITDLTATQGNANIPAGVQLTNIQNIVLNSSGNTAAGVGFSTVPFADVKTLTVATNGDLADIVTATNGANGAAVNVTHNGFAIAGTLNVVGGNNVTATSVGGAITVGTPTQVARVPLATEVTTGAIVVNQNGTGAGAVRVFGGTAVNVTTSSSSNTGAINIGNTAANTGNNIAGKIANASGNITVSNAGTGATTVFGGVDVTVSNSALRGAGAITVGDATRVDASNLPAGNVSITETAQFAFNGLAGSSNNNVVGGAIGVYGGKNVSITTNAANLVRIGNLGTVKEDTLNATGTITVTNTGVATTAATAAVLITGGTDVTVSTTGANVTIGRAANATANVIDQVSNPTGNVTVTETMNGNGFARAIVIDGGVNVTVNAKGQNVTIGQSVKSAPTGAVTVTQADMLTGTGAFLAGTNAGNVIVDGGTTVTVNTTGGNVTVGDVVGGVNTVPSGAVAITRTFSGPGADTTAVQGGTTVGITTTKTSGAITVGANSAALNAAGTALKDANLAPTGNVTIVDATTVGAATAYGTGAVNVNTNGATTVSIKGGDVDNVIDVQSTKATGGSGAGTAVGVSKLATVVIDGLQGANGLTIASDALTALSVLNTKGGANTVTITNNAAAHALNVTQGGNNKTIWSNGASVTNDVTVVDAKAGTITITDNATASTAILRVDAALATAATINNAAAATVTLGGASTNLATVTLKGAGATTLAATDLFGAGNLSKVMTVDASAATGNVTSAMQAITTAATAQKYLGGSGVDTLTINSNASGWGNLVAIDGGAGTADVLVANYLATGTDVALGNAASIKGFEILRLGAAASSAGGNYDASGFAEVQVGAIAGNVAITNAAASATLSVTANTVGVATVSVTGANTTSTTNAMTVNLGTAGTSAVAAGSVITAAANGAITANGIEALTVKAVGGYTSAVLATSANVATLNDAASAGAATVAITGTASLALTSNAGFTSIDASASTGQVIDVTAAKVSNVGTTFTGGAAVLKAAGSNDSGNFKALVTLTGTAANNFVVNETAVVTINGATYTYTSIGTNTAATVAGLLAAAITLDATTNNALGNVVKAGTGNPGVTAVASGGNIVLTKTSAFEVGTSKTAANATIADIIVGGQQQMVLEASDAITGGGNGNIVVTFAGGTSSITVAVANSDTTATIATKVAAGITAAVAANKPGIASAVVVDSTKVLVTMQSGEISQVAITTTAAFASGTGVTASDSVNFATVDNAFVTGIGGGTYKAGLGGSWNAISHKFSSGSETVNLTASAAKTDTLVMKAGATVTDNSVKGGVTKFVVGSQAASDVITFRNDADNADFAKTILANASTGTVNTVNGAAAMALVLDSSGALNTALANLTYTISNGVITFGATGGNNLSQFTVNQLISAAEILVSSTTTGAANKVAAFSYNGRSYVVSSDEANTLQAGVNNKSVIVELKDVASVKGFGSTFGEATVVGNVTNLTATAVDITALAVSSTLNYTGFAKATLAVTGTLAASTNTTKFTNLASSAELALGNTSNTNAHLGLLETTQVGTSGSNSLTVSTATNITTVNKLTVSGDAQLNIAPSVATTFTELVDATNTLNTIKVLAGAGDLTILKETGTALTTVDATLAGGAFTFGNGTFTTTTNYTVTAADAHNALTVKLAGGQNSTVWLSGTGDIITQSINTAAVTEAASVGSSVVRLVASGGANIITLGNGDNHIVANGASDVITVGTGNNTIVATGANDVFNIASGAGTTKVTVGTAATLNIGTLNTDNGGAETIVVTGAVTGGTTAGFAQTTINFVSGSKTSGHIIDFSGTDTVFTLLGTSGTSGAASQVNVAGAASLNDALNMAANFTLLTQAQGTAVVLADLLANTAKIDWFQFGGDTYVVAAVNNTTAAVQQTGLDANDIVVKIVGMVDLTGSSFNAGTETFSM